MKNIINSTVIAVVAAIIVVAVGFSVYQPKQITVTQPGQTIVRGSSPEISSPYIAINGVTQWYSSEPMRTATTSLCSFAAPLGTSTIEYFSYHITQGTSTSALIDIATSTNTFGTTTQNSLYSTGVAVAAGALTGIQWNGAAGSQANYVIYSSTTTPIYVNLLTEAAGQSGYTYGGACQVVFDQI